MPKRKAPASSFDPRFRDLLLRGALARIDIPCDTPAQAARLRHQMNQYRARLRDENGDGWQQMVRAMITIPMESPHIVSIQPRGSEFDSALSRAEGAAGALPPRPEGSGLGDLLADFDPVPQPDEEPKL